MDLTNVHFNEVGIPYVVRTYHCTKINKGISRKRYGVLGNCLECGKKFFSRKQEVKKRYGKFCSIKCSKQEENNPNWKGGRIKDGGGYIRIKLPNHPRAYSDGYVFEHRIIIESKLKRMLKPEEEVHHIDGDKENNRIDNLLLTTRAEHTRLHHKQRSTCGPNI